MKYFLIAIPFLAMSCMQPQQKQPLTGHTNDEISIDAPVNNKKDSGAAGSTENYDYQTTPFGWIKKYPVIDDTIVFIKALKENCHLFSGPVEKESINYIKKTRLYGSNKEFYLVEYDYHDGANCSYPWKNQLLFDNQGRLVKVLNDIRVDIVKIFPADNPFLISVSSTAHGNGWHTISCISSDTLKNVFDGFSGNRPQTYDNCEDNTVNEPNEFQYKITDANHDGYNDVVFYGKIVLIQGRTKNGDWYDGETINGKTVDYSVANPFKKIPAVFTFLFDSAKRYFIQQEDYAKKYQCLFGNTW